MQVAMNDEHCYKILVVDDAAANLRFLNKLLTEHGYTVYPASDGELALEFVRSILPDLILLDVRIPGIDGFEICRRLKAGERTRDIPVIFISILEDEQDKVRGLAAGAVDYITKPFQPEEVLARIGTHLRLRELAEHLERTVAERTEELLAVNNRLENELAERNRIEDKLRESENRFRLLFENSPVSIWEEDFSSVLTIFKKLEKDGVVDIEAYFDQNPETIRQCARLVRIVDVNRAALALHEAANKDELLEGLVNTFAPESFEAFRKELVALWQGRTELEFDAVVKDFTGRLRYVSIYFSVCPGYERTLSKIFISLIDIGSRKRAEEALSLNAERMEVLFRLNQMTDQTLDEIMGYAFEAAVRLTRSQLGYLVLVNEDETLLTMQLWSEEAMSECGIHDKPKVFPVETTGL